jgi:hypothetical protein
MKVGMMGFVYGGLPHGESTLQFTRHTPSVNFYWLIGVEFFYGINICNRTGMLPRPRYFCLSHK